MRFLFLQILPIIQVPTSRTLLVLVYIVENIYLVAQIDSIMLNHQFGNEQ